MKVMVTGGSGLVGRAICRVIPELEPGLQVYSLSSKDGDLRSQQACDEIFERIRPEYVIHLAARVGGVLANSENLYDFFYDNIMISGNVIDNCRRHNIKKIVTLLSTCIYPNVIEFPIKSEHLHDGEPHSSNYGYAFAKRMAEVQTRACNQQYGTKYICLIPNNIFGPEDNFHPHDSHVVPGLIRKIWDAKQSGWPPTLWGDGSPARELTYSDDIARVTWWSLFNYFGPPANFGTDEEITIKEVARQICIEMDYDPENIIWDTTKPSGQFRKPSEKTLKHPIKMTPFSEGIHKTVQWFLSNQAHARGM